jgi:hydrogenase maturation protease
MSRVAVVGLGNVLMGDDGFGPYVAKLLEGWYEWPDDVQVIEIGTQGVDLTPFVRGVASLLVLSAVHRKAPPGTTHRLSRAEIMDRELPHREPSLRNSPYEPTVRNLLLTLEFTGGAPRDAWVVGAEPESIELNGGLSESVRPALPAAVEAALCDDLNTGVRPRAREPRPTVLPWWEIRQGA